MDEQHTVPIPEAPGPGQTQVMPEVTSGATTASSPVATAPPPQTPAGGTAPPSDGGRDKRGTILLVVIVVAILLLGICGAAYILQRREARDLEQRALDAEARVQALEDDTPDEPADPVPPAEDGDTTGDGPATDSDDPADEGEDPAANTEDGRYIGLITDIYNVEQARWIEIDFIQFLTGQPAADAAAAAGDESPPPNDYYILNENPRLRDFNVREGLRVKMWTWNAETDGVTEQEIPFDVWWDAIEMGGQDQYLFNPYWVTVDNGTVIEIEEQFLP